MACLQHSTEAQEFLHELIQALNSIAVAVRLFRFRNVHCMQVCKLKCADNPVSLVYAQSMWRKPPLWNNHHGRHVFSVLVSIMLVFSFAWTSYIRFRFHYLTLYTCSHASQQMGAMQPSGTDVVSASAFNRTYTHHEDVSFMLPCTKHLKMSRLLLHT